MIVNLFFNGIVFFINILLNIVFIFEMEVVVDGDKLCVVKKVLVKFICYIRFFLIMLIFK